MSIRSLLIASALALARETNADTEPPPANVRVEVQIVSIAPATAIKLVPELLDEKTAPEACARVQQMLAREEAKLLGWPVLWVKQGDRSLNESIEEIRYSTEFEPPGPPQVTLGPGPNLRLRAWGLQVPTSFETRNTGPTLKAEAAVSADANLISLSLHLISTRFVAFQTYETQASNLGIEGRMQQPEFVNLRSEPRLTLRNGSTVLANVFVLQKPQPHVVLLLLRATATLLPKTTPPLPSTAP